MEVSSAVYQQSDVASSPRDEENIYLLDMSDVCCEVHVDESPSELNAEIEIGCSMDADTGFDVNIEPQDSFNDFSSDVPDGTCEISENSIESSLSECSGRKKQFKDSSTQSISRPALMSVEDFRDDPEAMQYYTGLESYEKFLLVFNTLVPDCYDLDCHRNDVPVNALDQLFLTLMKLRTNKVDFELSRFFGINVATVSYIFITWTVFIYKKWSLLDMWPSRQLINYYMPPNFESQFPSARVIIDCFEVPISKPVQNIAQYATFSHASNMHSLKILIGVTPGGLVSFCSEAYGGATSDDEMVELSGILDKLEPKDYIIADKRFNIHGMCAMKDVNVYSFNFKRASSRLLGPISSLPYGRLNGNYYPFEGLSDLVKRNQILVQKLSLNLLPLASEICYVCIMLCNFLECPAKNSQVQLQTRLKV